MTDAWDGRPENPERDGWHWLQNSANTFAAFWVADGDLSAWTTPIGDGALLPEQITDWRYLGPCLTPAEVEAQRLAAWSAAVEAAAGVALLQEEGSEDGHSWAAWPDGFEIAEAIRALQPPGDLAAAAATCDAVAVERDGSAK